MAHILLLDKPGHAMLLVGGRRLIASCKIFGTKTYVDLFCFLRHQDEGNGHSRPSMHMSRVGYELPILIGVLLAIRWLSGAFCYGIHRAGFCVIVGGERMADEELEPVGASFFLGSLQYSPTYKKGR